MSFLGACSTDIVPLALDVVVIVVLVSLVLGSAGGYSWSVCISVKECLVTSSFSSLCWTDVHRNCTRMRPVAGKRQWITRRCYLPPAITPRHGAADHRAALSATASPPPASSFSPAECLPAGLGIGLAAWAVQAGWPRWMAWLNGWLG